MEKVRNLPEGHVLQENKPLMSTILLSVEMSTQTVVWPSQHSYKYRGKTGGGRFCFPLMTLEASVCGQQLRLLLGPWQSRNIKKEPEKWWSLPDNQRIERVVRGAWAKMPASRACHRQPAPSNLVPPCIVLTSPCPSSFWRCQGIPLLTVRVRNSDLMVF